MIGESVQRGRQLQKWTIVQHCFAQNNKHEEWLKLSAEAKGRTVTSTTCSLNVQPTRRPMPSRRLWRRTGRWLG